VVADRDPRRPGDLGVAGGQRLDAWGTGHGAAVEVCGCRLRALALLCPLLVYGRLGLPRLELPGSAVANLVGQWLTALLFGHALLTERVSLRLDRIVLRAQVLLGRDLIARTLAFQVCFISAAAVAARFGAAAITAHQVVLQLWNFLAGS
jgi:Na+-driven multidrug efflux pump